MSGLFRGGFGHAVDEKGRVTIPQKFRALLGEKFIVTKGLDGCLFVLTEEQFRIDFEDKFQEHPLDPRQRRLQRFFSAEALDATTDSQGRVALPASLREHAGIAPQSEVMVVGLTNRVEIWNKERWVSFNESFSEEDLLPPSPESRPSA